MNQRNGVGKTTTVANLGCMLALGGAKTLLVDLDPQAGLTDALGCSKLESDVIRELYGGSLPAQEAIKATGGKNLYALPSAPGLGGIEIENQPSPNRNRLVKRALSAVNEEFDYILIDCPSVLEFFITNAACASNAIIIPVPCLPKADADYTTFMVAVDRLLFANSITYDYIGIFYNYYNPTSGLARKIVSRVNDSHTGIFFETRIPRCRAIAESVFSNIMAAGYDITALGTMAFGKLAREVLQHAGKKIA
ncbi:MAG: ParA family protein [Planctomycetota bacterium]|jgi:chromosome partitioning protein